MRESAKKRGQYCLGVGENSPTAAFGLPSEPLFAASPPLFYPCAAATVECFPLHPRVALRPGLPKFGVSMGQTATITTAAVRIHANRKIGGYFAPKRAAWFFTLHFQKKKEFKDLILIFPFALFFFRACAIYHDILHTIELYII